VCGPGVNLAAKAKCVVLVTVDLHAKRPFAPLLANMVLALLPVSALLAKVAGRVPIVMFV